VFVESVFALVRLRKGWSENIMKFDFKKLLGFRKYDILGLDIGSSSVRLVQLEKDNGAYTVVSAGMVEIEQVDDNPDQREANTIKAVQKCMDFANVRTRRVVCSVSGPEVAVRHFEFPPLEREALEGAVRLEAAQLCPFNIDEGVVDYQLMPSQENENVLIGVLVAAPNGVVHRKQRIVEKSSLSCVLMDCDGLALLNCLAASKKDDKPISSYVVLDIGVSCTILAIMSETGLPFVRTLPYAGNDIIESIAEQNSVRPDIVRNDIYASEQPTIPREKLLVDLEKACKKLISDVSQTLRYHSTRDKSSPAEQVLVCGSFGMVKDVVDILNKHLFIDVNLWNPFDTMKCNVNRQCLDVIQQKGPGMAVAAGLAMRSI